MIIRWSPSFQPINCLTSLPLCLVLVGAMLNSNCSVGQALAEKVEPLVLWHAYESGGAEQKHLHQSIERFKGQNPQIDVRIVSIPFEPFVNKINVSVPRGNGPDVFIFGHDVVGDWASKALIEPIGLWIGGPDLESIHGHALDAFVFEKELYGMPMTAKTLALYYRPSIIASPATTTAELRRQVMAFRQRMGQRVGLAYDVDDFFFHAPWFFGAGGQLFDQGQIAFDKPAFREATIKSLSMIKDWVDHGIVPRDIDYETTKVKFRNGEVAYVLSGPWFASALKDVDFAIAPLPLLSEVGETKARPFMTVEGIFISRRSRRKKAALQLLRFLASDGEAAIRRKELAAVGVKQNAPPAQSAMVREFERQILDARPTPNIPKMKSLWSPMNRVLSEVIKRGIEPTLALDDARRLLERGDD